MFEIPEPLKNVLSDYCHVEWAEEMNELASDISSGEWAYDVNLYRSQLENAIRKPTFSLKEFEEVTGEELDDLDDLKERLQELLDMSFPSE